MGRLGNAGKQLAKAEELASTISQEFRQRGIHHALVGGLAVIEHGYMRATADVDMIVVEQDRVQGAPLGIPGVTFKRDGVSIDVMFIDRDEKFLEDAVFKSEQTADGVPVISLPALVYLKLKAKRQKDIADVVELLKVNSLLIESIRWWLQRYAPKLSSLFQHAVVLAQEETSNE